MVLETAEQPKVDFGDLIFDESQKSEVVKVAPQTPTLGHFSSWI